MIRFAHRRGAAQASENDLKGELATFGQAFQLGEWADDPYECTCANGFYYQYHTCYCGSAETGAQYDSSCPRRTNMQGCNSWYNG